MRSIIRSSVACALSLLGAQVARAQCELSGDPLLTDTSRGTYGVQIAVGDEWLVVQGGRSDPTPFHGSLNVYRRTGSDWTFDAVIELGAFNNDRAFGNNLDVFGNRISVSVRYGPGGPYGVRIYRRDAGGWVLEQELSESAAGFGNALAMGDDLVFVSTSALGAGAVAVFEYRRNGTTWSSESEFICPGSGGDINNGTSRPVAYDDGVLVIGDHTNCNIELAGALSARDPGSTRQTSAPAPSPDADEGAAAALGCAGSWNYTKVFRRTGEVWVSEGTLSSDPLFCDGIEVAVDGDVIAMLAEHFQNTGYDVMIFEPGIVGWDRVATFRPSLQQAHLSAFPLALDVNGGRIAIGFHAVDHPLQDTGAAFLINQVNGNWQETSRFVANAAAADDEFGYGVALDGQDLLVTAPWREVGGVVNTGALYSFNVSDCDGDGFPDECPGGCDDPQACGDCNNNGTRDGCDQDCDGNGVPDDCECVQLPFFTDVVAPCCNNRFIEVVLPDSCQRSAARVKMVSLHHPMPPGVAAGPNFSAFEFGASCIEGPAGCVRWAGAASVLVDSLREGTVFNAAMLSCNPQYHDWGGQLTVSLTGAEIISSSVYEVQFLDEGCDPAIEANYSAPVIVETNRWADVAVPYQDKAAPSPNQPTAVDIAAVVDKVKDAPGNMPRVSAELSSQLINLALPTNAIDIAAAVDAVKGNTYPFAAPTVCN